jgi:sulfate permease, SulP family
MSEPHKWRSYLRAPLEDRLLLLLTLVLTVFADLTVAIGVGVAVGLALRLRKKGPDSEEWQTPER